MNVNVRHRIKRIAELFTSSEYRFLLKQRLLTWIVRKLNPNVIYLGIQSDEESMLVHCHDKAVTPYTLATGNFQKSDIEKICNILILERKPLGGAFFDIGGNIGSTSIYAALANKFSNIYCFEPVPDNIRLAKANFALNSLEKKIELIPKALSDKSGMIQMVLSVSNAGDHRIAGEDKNGKIKKAQSEGNFTKTIDVVATTIDDFVAETPEARSASVIWSDTQGFEGKVLKGGLEFIQKTKVPLCLEFWPFGLRNANCLDDFVSILEKNYEKFYDLNEADPVAEEIGNLSNAINRYPTEFQHSDLLFI